MNTELQRAHVKTSVPAFVLGGAAGTVVATATNAALFLATSSWAFPPDALIAWAGVPVNLGSVIISTAIGGALAVGGYALLRRFLPSLTSAERLGGLAAVVLLLLAYPPFTIQNVGTAQIVVMQLMHLVAGLVPLVSIIRAQR